MNARIDRIQALIAAMIEEYAQYGPTSSILDVTAQSRSFTPNKINGLAGDAQNILARTTGETDDQTRVLERLDDVVAFLRLAAFCQSNIVRSFTGLDTGKTDAFASLHMQARDELDEADESRGDASNLLRNINQQTSVEATAATDELSESDYTDKIGQFDSEIESLGTTRSFLDDFITADENLVAAQTQFERGNFDRAESLARRADSVFEDLRISINDAETGIAASIRDMVDEIDRESRRREFEAEDLADAADRNQ